MGVFGTKQSPTRYESVKQEWETPPDLFAPLEAEFHFTLDAAADAENTKAENFFTVEQDGLRQNWGSHTVWVNPPYGDGSNKLKEWVDKACMSARFGATVVMLIPARTNTNWFHDYCLQFGEVRFLRGRPKFIGCEHGLPQPLCLVIFRPPSSTRNKLLELERTE